MFNSFVPAEVLTGLRRRVEPVVAKTSACLVVLELAFGIGLRDGWHVCDSSRTRISIRGSD